MDLVFDRDFDPAYGRATQVTPRVRRVTAPNPGPFTFRGTNTFIVGQGCVAVIDPGPDDAAHRSALLQALAGETVTHILMTHSHLDHTAGAIAFASDVQAPLLGGFPIRAPEHPAGNVDYATQPDIWLKDGTALCGEGWTIDVLETPGHLSNHLCFALREEALLFSGDHVMAWSTTVVLPPHGSMRDYRASLRRLLLRDEDHYLPAHGPQLRGAKHFVEALLEHRAEREQEIMSRLAKRAATIAELVADLYPGLSPDLTGGASGSIEAHLIELMQRGAVRRDAHAGAYFLSA